MDIRRHWFDAVDRDGVLAVAELEREKGWRGGEDGVRTVIGRGKGWASGVTANINLGDMSKGSGNGKRLGWREGKVVRGDWLEGWCCGEMGEGRIICGRQRQRLIVWKELGWKGKVSAIEGLGR